MLNTFDHTTTWRDVLRRNLATLQQVLGFTDLVEMETERNVWDAEKARLEGLVANPTDRNPAAVKEVRKTNPWDVPLRKAPVCQSDSNRFGPSSQIDFWSI